MLIQKTWRGYQCRKNYGAVSIEQQFEQSGNKIKSKQRLAELSSSLLSDASWLFSPPSSGSFQEVVRIVSRGPSANHSLPGSLSRLLGASSIQAPAVGRHHHPGLHERNDRSTTVQEAEGRGTHTHTQNIAHVHKTHFTHKFSVLEMMRSRSCHQFTKSRA